MQKQYTAIFAIGGKLLGSFRGAMAAAQARLAALQRFAGKVAYRIGYAIGASMKRLATIMAGAFTGLAAFGVGKILSHIFHSANEEAREQLDVNRRLLQALMKNANVAKHGLDYAREQRDMMLEHHEAVAKVGLATADMLDKMAAELALSRLSPKEIEKTLPILADVLIAKKGIAATEEDAIKLARLYAKQLQRKPTRGLVDWGLNVPVDMQKAFKEMKVEDINEQLKSMSRFASGANIRALSELGGQTAKFTEDVEEMSERIGMQLLPAQDKMSQSWRDLLPQIEPYLKSFKALGIAAQQSVADYMRDVLLPAMKDFSTWLKGPGAEAWNKVKAAWGDMSGKVGKAFLNIWKSLGFEGKNVSKELGDVAVKALNALAVALKWVGDNADWLVPTVLILTGAFIALNIALSVTAALIAVTPIGWIIIGITALVTALVLLVVHWKRVRAATLGFIESLERLPLVGPVFQWLLAPIKQLIKLIDWLWNFDWKGMFVALTDAWKKTKDIFTVGWDYLKRGFIALGHAILEALLLPINKIIDAINVMIRAANKLNPFKKIPEIGNISIAGAGGAGGAMGAIGRMAGAAAGVAPAGMAPAGTPMTQAALSAVQAERADIVKELQRPELQNLISATLATEAGTAEDQKNVLEAMTNRGVAQKRAGTYKGVENLIKGGFYGPYNRGETQAMMAKGLSDARAAQVAGMVSEVGAGRNALRGMTDQGMVNEIKGYAEKVGEDYYGFMQGLPQQYETAAYQGPLRGYQEGGIASRPQLATLAESGPEAVIPLAKAGGIGGTSVNFAPNITINGNATEGEQRALDAKLRSLARDFVAQFKRAQANERRLSYEGGYG